MTTSDPLLPPYNWTFWRVVWATLVLVAVGLGFWLLYRFHETIFNLFVAIVIGTIIRPVVAWLRRRGLTTRAGIIVVYLLLLVLLTSFGLLLFPLIAEQSGTLTAAVPDYYQSLKAWLHDDPNQFMKSLNAVLPATFSLSNPTQQTGQEVLDSAGQLFGYVGVAGQAVFTAVSILILAFYWTLDGPRIIHVLVRLLPIGERESGRELITAMETKVTAYIGGQGILMLIIGSVSLLAYGLIGLPYALVLALVAGVMEAVPNIGPFIGAVPALLVALSIGPDKAIWVIVATLVIQQLENSILVPRIMSKAVGVNPFVTLLALFAFGSLLGITGALMAIPMAAIIQLLLERFVFHPDAAEPEMSAGRDYASRLRYEAQALAQDLRKHARLTQTGSDQQVKEMDGVMDELETITADLDRLLAQVSPAVGE